MIPGNPNEVPPDRLPVMYWSLLAGQVLIGIILYFLAEQSNSEQTFAAAGGLAPYQIIAPLLLLFAILIAAYLRARFSQSAEKPDPKKVATMALVAWALIEGANLATVILAYLNDDKSLFALFAAGILAFVWFRPATWPLTDERV